MPLTTLIIDDEAPARMLISKYLEEFGAIQVIGECADGFSAAKAINEQKPELIFLDVQMPKLSGFELLELIEHKPQVVFTTAYDSYAVQAFEHNAVDYLLKPFSKERFAEAISRVVNRTAVNEQQDYASVLQVVESRANILQRVAVKSGVKIEVIPIHEIFHIDSDGDYVMIYSARGKFLKEKTMKYFEQHLDSSMFVRVHRSSIINLNEISRIELFEKDSYVVKLKNGDQVKTSTAGYRLLKDVLNL